MNAWRIRGGSISLKVPRIMGILNITPDSFSDGGQYTTPQTAAAHARAMVSAGADVIDIGAQSTRPGALPLSAEEEWARLAAVLPAVRAAVSVPLSVDTFHPQVAERALAAGVNVINDVSGGLANGMVSVAAAHGAGMIFMRPGDPALRDVPAEVVLADAADYFARAAATAEKDGLPPEAVCFDVGIGFGSSAAGDVALITHLAELAAALPPAAWLVGASRKRVVAELCGDMPPAERVYGTVALHTLALWQGAHILRVHDVKEAVQAARIVWKARNI